MKNIHVVLLAIMMILPLAMAHEASSQQEPRNTPGRTRYVVVPIEGVIGTDVTAKGVEEVIRQTAGRADHNCLIFTFDTIRGDIDEAFQISQIINRNTQGMDVVGVLKKCIGPGLAILLACDQIYIEEPLPQGIVIEFQDSFLANSSSEQHNLRRQQVLYGNLVENKPQWQPIIAALTNPETSLYAWTGDDGMVVTSNEKPVDAASDVTEIDLTKRLGMTADEAIEAGLAYPATGGINAIGESLGYSLFQASSLRGDQIIKRTAETALESERAIDDQISEAFEMLANAQSLSGDLSRLRYRASNNDNEESEEGADSRTYLNGRWQQTNHQRGTRQAERSAQARDRWGLVIESLDRIQTLERNARKSINELEEAAREWAADDPRIQALGLLNEELSELRGDSYKLGSMRDEAVREYDLMDEQANPMHIDNSSYRRFIRINQNCGNSWGWGYGGWGHLSASQEGTAGFTPFSGGGGISTTR